MDELAQTIKSYDSGADWHSAKFDAYNWSACLSKFIKMLRGKRALDFGCGNGRDCEFFAKNGFDVTGIDYSAKLLERAKSRVKKAKFFKANFLEPLQFSDDEFDGVWACASLLHVPKKNLPAVLGEIKRVLRPQGALFVSVKKGKGESFRSDSQGKEKRKFSYFGEKEIARFLDKAVFATIQAEVFPDSKVRQNLKPAKENWLVFYCINEK